MTRKKRYITFAQAINEALDQSLNKNAQVFLIGLGINDPSGVFGTTKGLKEKHGKGRVMDMPVAENGMTGICIGTAVAGMRPVMTHQRVDFTLLACDQIINNAAKWFYMFGEQASVPIVIRMIIGRGWGQGSQHSQSLQALYAHIPGLKVVMPSNPYNAKGLLISAVNDDNPVIFIEHRWLHNITGHVPKKYYSADIHSAKVVFKGKDISLVSTSYMTLECIRARKVLAKYGISAEIVDLVSLKPFDTNTIIGSVTKTGRLLVADTGYKTLGVAAEVITLVSEQVLAKLKTPPQRITLPDVPTPTSWMEAEKYYPTYLDIVKSALTMTKHSDKKIAKIIQENQPATSIRSDVPDVSFTGPF